MTWYTQYGGSWRLTEEAVNTLKLFTEEEWLEQIPLDIQINCMKLTVEQSYILWSHWVNTGVWLRNYNTKEAMYFVDGTVRHKNLEVWK